MTAGRTPTPADEPPPDLSGDWQLDAEPPLDPGAVIPGEAVLDQLGPPDQPDQPAGRASESPVPASPVAGPSDLSPSATAAGRPATAPADTSATTPPSPEQLIEAMLFVGGQPLTAAAACSAIRGLTPEQFRSALDALVHRYRRQRRPYTILPRDDGFALTLLPRYRGLRDRLFGGPREVRLSQAALDVLAVIAYRQPVGKAEVDAIRGSDSGAVIRQLLRLGLVAVRQRGESGGPAVRYGTTPRFLSVFGLGSLDELPRLGDTGPA